MIESYKGRTVRPGDKVFAYRNLHRDMWSLKAADGEHKGKVVAHATRIVLRDASFLVSEAGRQRVIREGKKNVHAGVVGTVAEGWALYDSIPLKRVRYNPYQAGAFRTGIAQTPVTTAALVDLNRDGSVYI